MSALAELLVKTRAYVEVYERLGAPAAERQDALQGLGYAAIALVREERKRARTMQRRGVEK